MNRTTLALVLSVVGVTLVSPSCGKSAPTAPAGATIITIPTGAMNLGTAAFGTNPYHVPVGTKLAWLNSDSTSHTSTSTGNWDTGSISPGTYSSVTTIATAGTYNYFCSIHGQSAMSGQIISP